MAAIRRKILQNLSGNTQSWPDSGSVSAGTALSSATRAGSSLGDEYRAWARRLDALQAQAQQGDDSTMRALARGKLSFLLRRCLLLQEKVMMGGGRLNTAQKEAIQLACELEQVVGELSGHTMTHIDDWPLPYRLYSRNTPPARTDSPTGTGIDRRQGWRTRQNSLSEDERSSALQAVSILQLALQLRHPRHSADDDSERGQAQLRLKRIVQLGRLTSSKGQPP